MIAFSTISIISKSYSGQFPVSSRGKSFESYAQWTWWKSPFDAVESEKIRWRSDHSNEEELGGTNFYRTAQPTKNGAYRDFLKIYEISIFLNETSSQLLRLNKI